ncbi:hypothetical protein SEA_REDWATTLEHOG_14 [Gordonia phage RedWattleHog]|uniref:Uncharacterized protein n=1 Tax=Gordonia phage Stormageddon TaxID=2656541 RepID=A0A649VQV5_9CAUD|nr:hypothetical protein KHQ86_gp014 [Gordonia phage Stormageddon]QGJ94877.1 hypothetical protein SEA_STORMAGEDDON_14 [Gordonia phage Stormageddon]QLF83518.1 hypothetical protein SEA_REDWATTLEHOG_14 [Gordonia phage RedWattleHog]
MFMVPVSNPAIKRTIRPLYAQHQATTWAGFLDPNWDRSFDILPGCVMTRLSKEVFAPYTGQANAKPFGLSAFFMAPRLGVEEVTGTGQNLFTVWVGNDDAEFEILAPAFDTTADWTLPTNGSIKLLTGNSQAKLTPAGATVYNAIAELIDVVGTDKIVIRPFRPTPGTGA